MGPNRRKPVEWAEAMSQFAVRSTTRRAVATQTGTPAPPRTQILGQSRSR